MNQPVIGISAARTQSRHGYPNLVLVEAYAQAVLQGGATPLIIPLGLPNEALPALLARVDGLVLSGGGDVQPELYGGAPHPCVYGVDPDRDRVDLELSRLVVEQGIPFLGICRGLQALNVALGGTLYEDLLAQHPGSARHHWFPEKPRAHLAHAVEITPGSRLCEILQERSLPVNSAHHQGIRSLAPGLLAAAYSPDGVLEAFELPGHPFGLAVQWHPEWLTEFHTTQRLWRALAEAAGQAAAGRHSRAPGVRPAWSQNQQPSSPVPPETAS